jgi:formiminoglutamase
MQNLRFQRALRAVDPSLVYRSNDVYDKRIGDVIVSVKDVSERAEVVCVLIGVPQHIGVERNGGRPGAADGPSSFRKAFTKLAISAFEQHIDSGRLAIADAGDIDTEGKTLEQIHDEQYDVVAQVLSSGFVPIVVGGGHDTAWPTIRALEAQARPYGVVNIDAHADVRPLKDGGRAHSGSPFYQMLTQQPSHLQPGGFVEFGLQHTCVSASHLAFVRDAGMHAVMLDEIRRHGCLSAWGNAWPHAAAAGNVYVSLDVDAFASAYAPGVSAPAADGLSPADVASILRDASESGKLRAFDIVELNPAYDVDGRTAKLTAVMAYEVVTGLATRL